MIRNAKSFEIDAILAMTKACAKKMASNGIYQWNEHYPSKKAFENDLQRNELYVLIEDAILIGSIVISKLKDEEYDDITWLTQNDNALYIHRLAVHPNFQGKGHAQKLMRYAENYAKEKNYSSIRLDTFSQNNRNQKFYEQRGYQKLGAIYFPLQSEYPFYCYELLV